MIKQYDNYDQFSDYDIYNDSGSTIKNTQPPKYEKTQKTNKRKSNTHTHTHKPHQQQKQTNQPTTVTTTKIKTTLKIPPKIEQAKTTADYDNKSPQTHWTHRTVWSLNPGYLAIIYTSCHLSCLSASFVLLVTVCAG